MKTSIIIPAYNNAELTKKCLGALKSNTPNEHLSDVIVVDNASSDGTTKLLESLGWVKTIFNNKNLGFAKACNQGAERASGDVLIFLNNDTEAQKGWLEPLLESLSKNKVAAVGSKLIFPDEKVQHAGIVISKDLIPRHIYYREDPKKEYVNKTREFQVLTAACLAVEWKVFNEVGGFDEGYLNGMEDVDLCLKIGQRGYKIIYCPKSLVVHHESVSEGRFKAVNENEEIYLKKWKGKVVPDEEKYYRKDGFGWFFITEKNLRNRFLVSSGAAKRKPFFFRVARVFYISAYRIMYALKLVFTLDFKTLSKKVRKVKDARS